ERLVAGLETPADWRLRREQVRETILELLGPFPERTPLNARVTGTVEGDGYRVEKIVFESEPGFMVTAALFLPEGVRGRGPAILHLNGHTQISFRGEAYQP